MGEHFLKKYVSGEQKFSSEPWYNSYGDCIIYKTSEEAIVADRIDEYLTIYLSCLTDEPVGFKIKGVNAILNKFGYDAIVIESKQHDKIVKSISMAALLLVTYEEGPYNIRRRTAYANLLDRESIRIPFDQICRNSLYQEHIS